MKTADQRRRHEGPFSHHRVMVETSASEIFPHQGDEPSLTSWDSEVSGKTNDIDHRRADFGRLSWTYPVLSSSDSLSQGILERFTVAPVSRRFSISSLSSILSPSISPTRTTSAAMCCKRKYVHALLMIPYVIAIDRHSHMLTSVYAIAHLNRAAVEACRTGFPLDFHKGR